MLSFRICCCSYGLLIWRNTAITPGSVTCRTSLLTSQLLCSPRAGEDQENSEAAGKNKLHICKAHVNLLSLLKEEEMASTSTPPLRKCLSLTECKWHPWSWKREVLSKTAHRFLAPKVQRTVRRMGQGIHVVTQHPAQGSSISLGTDRWLY